MQRRTRGGGGVPPPPLPMFEPDSQNFASAPSVPRGFTLQKFSTRLRRGTIGGPWEEGGIPASPPPPPPSDPPPPRLVIHPYPCPSLGLTSAVDTVFGTKFPEEERQTRRAIGRPSAWVAGVVPRAGPGIEPALGGPFMNADVCLAPGASGANLDEGAQADTKASQKHWRVCLDMAIPCQIVILTTSPPIPAAMCRSPHKHCRVADAPAPLTARCRATGYGAASTWARLGPSQPGTASPDTRTRPWLLSMGTFGLGCERRRSQPATVTLGCSNRREERKA